MAVNSEQSFNQTTVDWKPRGVPPFEINAMPSRTVDQAAIERYQSDGAVLLPGVFDEWVDTLRAGLERNMEEPEKFAFPCESTPDGAPGRFFDSYCNWLLIPEYQDHVTQSCAAPLAAELMRSVKAQFFHEHVFCKEPGTQQATPWHQDISYYCVEGAQTVSLYVSLDRAPAEVAVRFVRGSHRWERLFRPVSFLDGSGYGGSERSMEEIPDLDSISRQGDILSWDLEPGDCVAFNFRTLHGTTAGRVERRRRAVSTRWLGDDVVYCERPGPTSPPYSGIGLDTGDRMREDWFPVLWQGC